MTATALSARDELMSRLARIIATTLRVPIALVEPDMPFTALGMDSLAAIELTAAIEDDLAVDLPIDAVHEFDDLVSLVRFIERRTALDPTSTLRARMRRDAVLPADIKPSRRTDVASRTATASNVLVTGATGFVGAYLLRALLDETSATVSCFVRPGRGDATERVYANLRRYGLLEERDASRIRVVRGDLTAFMLGMRPETFIRVAESVDAIYHGAAAVNWVHGYDALRDANVVGTREILRLACTGEPKPVHFLSSLGVCYSTRAPRHVAEDDDMLPAIDGLHLGYAQSKCVAESLVRSAGARGLPVTITRPALVSGDSGSGASNVDDLLARFIAGCIRLGAAPDLDWRVDCVPVDHVARAVVRLSRAQDGGTAAPIAHLSNRGARHWRECVLWMRLCGYEIELLPYREWLEVLRATPDARNPLYPLRPFFLRQVDHHGLTLPELYEESRRSSVTAAQTDKRLLAVGVHCPPLSANLLDRYFAHYVSEGIVPPTERHTTQRRRDPAGPSDVIPSLDDIKDHLTSSLRDWYSDSSLIIRRVTVSPFESDDSIVSELTSWRHHTCSGLFHARLELEGAASIPPSTELVVKVKASDEQVLDVAEAVAHLASSDLGRLYGMFREHTGFTRSHLRELALYTHPDSRLRRNMPVVHAVLRDDAASKWLIAMERVDASEVGEMGSGAPWTSEQIEIALRGLAEIHSVWLGRERELATEPWLPPRRNAERLSAMRQLWIELARHARQHAPPWQSVELCALHERLAYDVESWATAAHGPRTLIHNDFNPRNITIRAKDRPQRPIDPAARRPSPAARLCAYDWELATIGLPQRDLAEFLAFVLSPHAEREEVMHWIDRYRHMLQREAGTRLAATDWLTGFRSALCELLVDRLAMYAMVDRFRPQRFLARVVATWLALYRALA